MASKIRTVLGTMSIGEPLNQQKAQQALDMFQKAGHSEIDTAIMYQAGKSEKVLGKLKVATSPNFRVATKVNPWYADGKSGVTQAAGLHPTKIREQVTQSLASLQAPKISLLYLHAPDHNTPLIDSLRAVHELHTEGKFDEWGLSNYAAWQVVDAYHICLTQGWKPPTVYQGVYNYVTREVEAELFPALRRCGMKFYAYNPLAGGILAGAHKYEDDPKSGRFNSTTVWGNKYRDRFWHKPIFESLECISELATKDNITLVDIAFRWLLFHSQLVDGDAVIIGGSSLDHIQSNLDAIAKASPLSPELITKIDHAWVAAKPECERYFR